MTAADVTVAFWRETFYLANASLVMNTKEVEFLLIIWAAPSNSWEEIAKEKWRCSSMIHAREILARHRHRHDFKDISYVTIGRCEDGAPTHYRQFSPGDLLCGTYDEWPIVGKRYKQLDPLPEGY